MFYTLSSPPAVSRCDDSGFFKSTTTSIKVKRFQVWRALHREPISELQSHKTQLNATRLNHSQRGWYSIYLRGGMKG